MDAQRRSLRRSLVLLAVSACASSPRPPVADVAAAPPRVAQPPLVVDRCADQPAYADQAFVAHERGKLRAHVLPGTAAERDVDRILAVRLEAIEKITKRLGVVETRTIDLYLSPNPVAAAAHDKKGGVTLAHVPRVEVLYLDEAESYERVSFGHELTHAVSHHLDGGYDNHFFVVGEGVAEALDQSGRDLHQVFVQAIRARGETVEAATEPSVEDATGANYPKAGSFVAMLLEREPRPEPLAAFVHFLRAGRRDGKLVDRDGKPFDRAQVEERIDDGLRTSYNLPLASFLVEWRRKLAPYLAAPALPLDPADDEAIRALVARRDQAISEGKADAYRATFDGFYCSPSHNDETLLEEAKREATGARTISSIEAIVVTGLRNYPTVTVRFVEERVGRPATPRRASVERFPSGWRFVSVR